VRVVDLTQRLGSGQPDVDVLVHAQFADRGKLIRRAWSGVSEAQSRRTGGVRRIYGKAQTPLARVLAGAQVSPGTKARLRAEKGRLNPFALEQEVSQGLKDIAAMRQERR